MLPCKNDDWHRIQDWPSWQSDDMMKGWSTMVGLSRIHPHSAVLTSGCMMVTAMRKQWRLSYEQVLYNIVITRSTKEGTSDCSDVIGTDSDCSLDMMKSGCMHRLLNSLKWSAASGVENQSLSGARWGCFNGKPGRRISREKYRNSKAI
jgi:hypothetical protein